MNYYVSYFYNIRFFTSNILPLSTALWDPKWFHDFKDSKHTFKNKNGVYLGLRADMLNPGSCHAEGCPCENHKVGVKECKFLTQYREGLEKVDFTKLINACKGIAEAIKKKDGVTIDSVVFLVYETPDNPCSERGPLIDYFRKHGIELKEWKKE